MWASAEGQPAAAANDRSRGTAPVPGYVAAHARDARRRTRPHVVADGVLYQIYPRSYMDANGDGVGDLRGIIDRLDHLQWLGVDGIWLDPISVSPNADWGYDVSDYCDVDPALGTLADADELIERSRSARHPRRARPGPEPHERPAPVVRRRPLVRERRAHRDWYVWADAKRDGSPPNNWVNTFDPRAPAWTFDDATGQYYLNNFLPSQPDLNWWNEDVRDAFDDIFRFWYDRGVAGFRLDVAHAIIKDRELRDNPPATKDDHCVHADARASARTTTRAARRCTTCCAAGARSPTRYDPPRVLVGETYVLEPELLGVVLRRGRRGEPRVQPHVPAREVRPGGDPRHGRGGRAAHPGRLRNRRGPPAATTTGASRPGGAATTREDARGDGDAADAARHAVPLLRRRARHARDATSPPIACSTRSARSTARASAATANARRCSGPTTPGAGFTRCRRRAVAPVRRRRRRATSQQQRNDPDSMLSLTRDLIGLRDAIPELRRGAYRTLPAIERCVVGVGARRPHARRGQLRRRARDGAGRRRAPSACRPSARATTRP